MKTTYYSVLIIVAFVFVFVGCGNNINEEEKKQTASIEVSTTNEVQTETEKMSDSQLVDAVIGYCCEVNPNLKNIVDDGEYPVYWDIYSRDEKEIVVVYRSYTGAHNYFHINCKTGDTYVTEFVPGITDEEIKTGEMFNVADYVD